ncbi:MAG TPA: DUF4139 domain-containing protein, partial [Bryobacteraceae bacterium]|nr:DUF4139 domain-containing protein [Bryobacteraceae bacterium]
RADEMNDVLKSLVITDSAGKVTGIRYDSNIPLDRKLNEFPFRIDNGAPLSAVLDQLKGARLEMEFGTQKTAGEIVSGRIIPADKDRAERDQLTLLTDSGEFRSVDLSAASSLRFTDPVLQTQFRDYLSALTGSRSRDKRSIYIDSSESGSRQVRAEYIMPMPAWKSSYRLVFDETGRQPTLEGWAVVDNTTGEDWTNVRMSLISGKPISFISQLYDPKYIRRETAELPEDQAVVPVIHSGSVALPAAPPQPPASQRAKAENTVSPFFTRNGGVIAGAPSAGLTLPEQLSTVDQAGPAAEIADLFEYSIRNPVTVKKNESAMLPFLQQKIAARKVIIYSVSDKTNPLSAAELTNNSGKTLDGGPITVYDGGAYAGEALVETMKKSDKRFISYGVDPGTRIATNLDSRTDSVREIHAHDGLLISRAALIQKKTYSIRNIDARAKTLIIEHPVRQGYKLIGTAQPIETAPDVYRFEMNLAANASMNFPVTEENVYDSQTAVSSLTPDALLVYVRNKSLTDAARRQLEQISDLKTQLVNNDAEKRRIDAEVQNITRDEDRGRQNISSLSSVSGQQQVVQEYARKLAEQETRIAQLRQRQTELETARASLQTQLNTLIGKLNF